MNEPLKEKKEMGRNMSRSIREVKKEDFVITLIEKLGLLTFINGGFLYIVLQNDIIGEGLSVIVSVIGMILYLFPKCLFKERLIE